MEGEIQGLWRKVYAVLMEIIKIQMMRPTQSIERKMKDLCAFMDESLGLVMHPELILAKRFFEKGRKLAFFDKIQRGREDIIEVVRNMTWDLFHLRMLELDCLVLISSRADFFIPYMFTYDKRLLQIRDCYMIDAMAINRKGFERFPFYTHIDEVLPFVQELSAPERYKLRRARNLEMDLPRFIGECERKLRDAMK